MTHRSTLKASLTVSGTFECRDADGNILSTFDLKGEVPLDSLTEEQRKQIMEAADGSHPGE